MGVFRDGVLVAYSKVQYAGDIAGMMRLMSHRDPLDNGAIFLLAAGIVGHVKSVPPEARYVFYDTFVGTTAGLRRFKTHLGFQPHFVHWKRK